MIKPIIRDVLFLAKPSAPATPADKQIAIDLLDTLKHNEDACVGMAANMIGISKRIIAVNMGLINVAMFNPVIIDKSGPYDTEESCLSLTGSRPVTRYEEIEVEYEDMQFNKQKRRFTGWTAQIIQHEIDHCDGILI